MAMRALHSEAGHAMSYEPDKEKSSIDDLSQHVKSRSTWLRFVFMLLFAVIFYVAGIVLFAVAAIQFLFMLFSGESNERLTRFGGSLARFLEQVAWFLTYNTEVMPFPFSDWPVGAPED
jgi:Flp pilus assembly protein TadB